MVAGPSKSESPSVEVTVLESLRVSLKEELTSEIKGLLLQSQRERSSLLKPKAMENPNKGNELNSRNESRTCQTPTKPLRINSPQACDSSQSCNKLIHHLTG